MRGARTLAAGLALLLPVSGRAVAEPRGLTAPETSAVTEPLLPAGVPGLYLEARFAMEAGDQEAAAADFQKLADAEGQDLALRRLAFEASLIAGSAQATRFAAGLPDDVLAQLLVGDQRAAAGDWAGARATFDALPGNGLGQVLQPILLAWCYAAAGQADAALALLRTAAGAQHAGGLYAMHAALVADYAGRADAGGLYEQAAARAGGLNLRLAQMLASWQARQGHQMQAEQLLERLLGGSRDLAIAAPDLLAAAARRPVASPVDGLAEGYLQMAVALQQQSPQPALLLVRLALALRPHFGAALLLASELESQMHRPQLALKVLDEAVADDPLHAVVDMQRANLLAALGRPDQARQVLQAVAASHPASPEPLVALGDLNRQANHDEQAVGLYDRAIALVPTPVASDWGLFFDRAIALDGLHRWPAAEADLRRALALSPDEPTVLNYLGYSYAVQNRELAQAQALIERALAHQPDDGAIMDSLGWVLLRRGDASGAVHWLERASAMGPSDPTVTGHLGDAYAAAGRPVEARQQWQRALLLHPDAEDRAHFEAELVHGSPSVSAASLVRPAPTGAAATP